MTKLTLDQAANRKLIIYLSKQCFKDFPVLQQLTAVQAIEEGGLELETPSGLALNYCNLFGMKPGSVIKTGTMGLINLRTTECDKYDCKPVQSPFLYNKQIEDSLAQHELLFRTLPRYRNLFTAKTLQQAAHLVQQDGYATDPNYADNLIATYMRCLCAE